MIRKSIVVAGLEHGTNPVPAASRIGPLLATGAVRGADPSNGQLPESVEDEVRFAFQNLVRVLEAGGASPADVAHVNVFVGADGLRGLVNDAWVGLFPDEASRPARHFVRHDLPGGMRLQLEALAYIVSGRSGVREPDPILDALASVDACAVSDALDAQGIAGVALGLSRLTTDRAVVGRAVTVRMGPKVEGAPPPSRHLGTAAVEAARPGDVIVIENGGRTDVAAWGGTLAAASVAAGVAGVVVDGAFRDRDECDQLGLPVYARAAVPVTARGRIVEREWGVPVTVCGVEVRPGDYVVADGSGVVFVPAASAQEVVRRAARIMARERLMAQDVARGVPVSQVMGSSYETMLQEGVEGHG